MNFVEHVAIAAREEGFSAAIAWLLGESSPLGLIQRLTIIAEAFDLNFQDHAVATIVAETEWKGIDVLLTLKNAHDQIVGRIAIENKINATEHGQQLQRYSDKLRATFREAEVNKVFLTVCGDAPHDADGWQARSYTDLRNGLNVVAPADRPDSVYVHDIQRAVGNLVDLVACVENPDIAKVAFREKEPDQVEDQELRQKAQYLRSARREKLTQRTWMTSLANGLRIPDGWERPPVEETHAQALLNIQRHIQVRGCNLAVGIQVQRRNLKLFCKPDPYGGNAAQQELDAIDGVLAQFPQIFQGLAQGRNRRVDKKGFGSFRWCAMPHGREIDAWRRVLQERINTLDGNYEPLMQAINALH